MCIYRYIYRYLFILYIYIHTYVHMYIATHTNTPRSPQQELAMRSRLRQARRSRCNGRRAEHPRAKVRIGHARRSPAARQAASAASPAVPPPGVRCLKPPRCRYHRRRVRFLKWQLPTWISRPRPPSGSHPKGLRDPGTRVRAVGAATWLPPDRYLVSASRRSGAPRSVRQH